MVRLRSSDGEEFEVAEKAISAASGMIKGMLEDNEEDCVVVANNVITLPNVAGPILSRVLQYVNRHYDQDDALYYLYVPTADDPLKRFDDQFVHVDQDTLFDLIAAANYLHIQGLLDLTCRTVADQMLGKTTEELRRHFHIVNDYTPDEEEEVRTETSWCWQ
ncbi:SKP1-like protein 4 [Hordeum vulgare]|nr:SKP1-like protein 4 [Hordeum vulgare]